MASLAILITLAALVRTEENLRGKWAWKKCKRELEAQGEKLDWKEYIPPPVPDDQNFAMTPFLAPLLDFNTNRTAANPSAWRDTNGYDRAFSVGAKIFFNLAISRGSDITWYPGPEYETRLERLTDLQAWALPLTGKTNKAQLAAAPALPRREAAAVVLRALEQDNPALDELRSASRRPYARFNLQYDSESAAAILLPHLAVLKRCSRVFALRASAELALARTDLAWADAQMVLYLSDAIKNEPILISRIVQVHLVQIALKPIWEGLAEHKWSDAQLVEIEQRLAKLNLLADADLRSERAFWIINLDQMRRFGRGENLMDLTALENFLLSSICYQNESFLAQLFQQRFVPVVDAANQRVYPSRALDEAALSKALASRFKPDSLPTQELVPYVSRAQPMFAFGQTRVNEAIVACALERYRLAQGQFPESLEPLCPRFLEKMPHDVITGAPLIYRRTPDGQFILYSVGWNEKDDGGLVVRPSPPYDETQMDWRSKRWSEWELIQGDWVWQYPGPLAPTAQQTAPE
jgi:hypothetical protein